VFTAEYKAEAVKLAGAVAVPTAARQLEIATKSLYLWIKQSTEGKLKASGPSKLSAEQQRIGELERQLAIARTERDRLAGRIEAQRGISKQEADRQREYFMSRNRNGWNLSRR